MPTTLPPTIKRCAAIGLIGASALIALVASLGGITFAGAQAAALACVALTAVIPFASVGLLVALLLSPDAAFAIISLVHLPLSFASGFWMLLRPPPHWAQLVAPGFTLLMLAAGWITFQRKENGVS